MTGSWKVESTNTLIIYHRHKLFQRYRHKKIAMYRLVYCEASSIRRNGVNLQTHTMATQPTRLYVIFLSINRSHCSRFKRGYRHGERKYGVVIPVMDTKSIHAGDPVEHQVFPYTRQWSPFVNGRPCLTSQRPL